MVDEEVKRQACPECDALPAPLEGVAVVTIRSGVAPSDCWRCDGFGFVDPYDDDLPTVVVRHRRMVGGSMSDPPGGGSEHCGC